MKLLMENWRTYLKEDNADAAADVDPADDSGAGNDSDVDADSDVDWMGAVLDALGFIPLAGEPIDAFAAIRHIKRKEYFYALLSAISVIPEIGDVIGKSTKYITKGGGALAKLFKGGKAAGKITKATAKTVKSAEGLQKILGKPAVRKLAKFVKDNEKTIKATAGTLKSKKAKKAVAENITINIQEVSDESAERNVEEFFEFLDDLVDYAESDVTEEPEELGLEEPEEFGLEDPEEFGLEEEESWGDDW